MAAKANVIGIYIKDGGTLTLGRESTVADDGVAGINLRAYLSTSFIVIDDASGANLNGNTTGSNTSSSRENQVVTTGYDTNDKNVEIFADSMDAGIVKFKINHSAADKTVKLEDTGLSDITFDTGTTSILGSNISTSSAIIVGSNAGSANTVLDVSSNNYSIRCGQGMTLYNGGTLLARAATLYLGTTDSSPYAGENSSRYGLFVSNGKVGGTSTSAAPTGTWYASSIRCTTSGNILRFTTGTCTITGKNTSANRFFELTDGNVYHSNGTITIDSGVAAEMQWDAASTDQDNGPYNFIINDASCTARIFTDLEVLNNMTVTAGTFNTHSNDDSADKDLTVTGNLDISGTVTCNASDVTVRAVELGGGGTLSAPSNSSTNGLIITQNLTDSSDGDAFDTEPAAGGATFTHNSGTVTFKGNKNVQIRNTSGENFHNVVIDCAAGGDQSVETQRNITMEGDLTIKEGAFRSYASDRTITVNGDVSIENGGVLGGALGTDRENALAYQFGSLSIASGGTYLATTGTTTITNNTATGTRSVYNNGGTFTHNNGTLKIDTSANTNYDFDGDDLYNFTVECEDGSGAVHCDGEASTAVTVLNNLDIVMGKLRTNGNTFTVHGNVYVRATSKTNKNKFVGQGQTQNVYGLITVEDGAFFDLANEGSGSYGTLNAGGIRIL
jgi:hypothetical protein